MAEEMRLKYRLARGLPVVQWDATDSAWNQELRREGWAMMADRLRRYGAELRDAYNQQRKDW